MSEAGPTQPAPERPSPLAYADEVLGGVRIEWDAFNRGFSWLTSLLGVEIQARAFGHLGGPAAARRATHVSAFASALAGLYGLSFLPGGPAADPLAPGVVIVSLALLGDALRRLIATRAGRYAPSFFRCLLPSGILRPERAAFRAHQQAERATLRQISRSA